MDSLLVITNRDAGTADEETLDRALASLFDQASVEVTATSNPGELDGVLHRAGSRRSSSPAATAACTRWSPRSTAATT